MAVICLLLPSVNTVLEQECCGNAITAKDEDRPLFLGSCQRDQNTDRAKVVAELDEALEDLGKFISSSDGLEVELPCPGKFLLRSRQIFELDQADPQAVKYLQNWVNGG
ncbi:hypothetical protein FVEG_16314 [Fusarium verticillioides 7600]|uniref:Uncharacterized protein n=1 Tax=Gibberella moniliformis (strain M3125 / FGSC 7600) TaxID=334819 RepID=W7MCI6_GIBM7|nr:hypothetical protein FVEG_16314 [Fusarium verticillioides 7600]EWG48726.1 hypothetical protein FVEG_16314 [Fusarium verticillioides 7600]